MEGERLIEGDVKRVRKRGGESEIKCSWIGCETERKRM